MRSTATVSVSYRCPHCEYGFVRRTGKMVGSTSCPKCLKRFNRKACHVLGDEATNVRREASSRKHERCKRIYTPDAGATASAVIRGEQIPVSISEAKFKARATAKGWLPHRPSWPDFLVETDSGLIAVEVKSRTDGLSGTQVATFALLEAAGIPVYIWKDKKLARNRLSRFGNGKAPDKGVDGMLSACEAFTGRRIPRRATR